MDKDSYHGYDNECLTINLGMTLRDYFAAKALQGFIQYSATKGIYTPPDDQLAKAAYDLADAMMKAREQ